MPHYIKWEKIKKMIAILYRQIFQEMYKRKKPIKIGVNCEVTEQMSLNAG